MADALEPLLKKIRIAIGKKLGMPSYQEVNAQDFPAQIDRILTPTDDSIPKYQGPFMITPGPNAQTIQTEGKYSEANITVAPAPPSGVEIKTHIFNPKNGNKQYLTSNKNIIPFIPYTDLNKDIATNANYRVVIVGKSERQWINVSQAYGWNIEIIFNKYFNQWVNKNNNYPIMPITNSLFVEFSTSSINDYNIYIDYYEVD